MIGIVVSRADRASTHIGERLLERAEWTERTDDARADADGGGTYHTLDASDAPAVPIVDDAGEPAGDAPTRFELRSFADLHIHLDDPTPAFSEDPAYLVFVSRHSGDTGPLLTCHFTGNFGDAEYGGEPGSFAPACPGVQRALVAGFDDHAPDGYGVAIEGTHHGPTDLATPAVFAELGSDDEQWDDPDGADAVARAVLALPARGATVAVGDPDRPRHVVGFGGGHYAPRFERVIRETAWGVGHIAADWQVAELGHPEERPDVLDAAIRASDADFALIEGEYSVLREALADRDVRVVGESWVRAVDDRPLDLVDALEADLRPVDDGLRFGERTDYVGAAGSDPGGDTHDAYRVVDLPGDLLAEAQGIDPDAARAAVERHAVAFETEQAGTRAAGRAALPASPRESTRTPDGDAEADSGPYDALVDDLAAVLAGKYDEVVREGDAVRARVESFDPQRAATLGIPEGPKFGALSAGEPVEVDGETIRPETVSREREKVFAV
ncbi:D-aminoacyl-tRNA deacylase [Halobaculum gomorrense]|uniref:D-aminoacyl-tRNA deacylase n=1 Tax=Halobaculum gomorrense TaxID=43928 RepID=A0A1M5QNK0_9EURY|nr:D-aminoacyl-tRNA deacylase [Halobaculum gomorrense]SHH15655.1 D-aminoacyl-tRNA deacylase [Halobaculum gomorrense]